MRKHPGSVVNPCEVNDMNVSRSDKEINLHRAPSSDPSDLPPVPSAPLSDPTEPPPILSLSEEAAQARWERAFASITQKRAFSPLSQKRTTRARSTFEESLRSRPGPKLARSRQRG